MSMFQYINVWIFCTGYYYFEELLDITSSNLLRFHWENVHEKKINHISWYVHIYDLSFVITKGHLSFILTTPKKLALQRTMAINNDTNCWFGEGIILLYPKTQSNKKIPLSETYFQDFSKVHAARLFFGKRDPLLKSHCQKPRILALE